MKGGWECSDVVFRYPGADCPALDGVSMDAAPGRCTTIIGPNGSGKSTLLKLLLGVLAPDGGTTRFGGRPVSDWPRRELARAVGVVPQGEEMPFPLSVRALVEMGRYPHLGAFRAAGAADRAAVEAALRRADMAELAARPLATLSGGERQRARIARALAQRAPALALDEPTVSLDVAHEMAIFELLRALRAEGRTILLVTHNLNLAARYADRLVLLDRGRVAAAGSPAEVLTTDNVGRVYGWPVRIVPHPGPGPDTGAPQIVALAGDPAATSPDIATAPNASDHFQT